MLLPTDESTYSKLYSIVSKIIGLFMHGFKKPAVMSTNLLNIPFSGCECLVAEFFLKPEQIFIRI